MSLLNEMRKVALREYLNQNRVTLEEDVDELINELWKLKRKIHHSKKDTHYDAYDLILAITKTTTSTDVCFCKWETDINNFLVEHSVSAPRRMSPRRRVSTLTLEDYF